METSKSILVVEDERVVALDLQRTLIDFGYQVPATAASAEQAIALASEHCPDLVLMDIHLKGDWDGIETASIFRERFGVPVVYLTAYADTKTVDRAKLTEPYGYLIKPVKVSELRSVIEITLYKHVMDRRVRERERWFSTALHSMGDAVVVVDLAGRITYMNPEAEVLTGMKAADVVGHAVHEVLHLLDDQAKMLEETPIARVLHDQEYVKLFEGTLRNVATGAVRTITDSTAPMYDDTRMLGAVMVFRDVTEQKKKQKQVEFVDRLASLGAMVASVAHEVNNPLAVVISNAAFVNDEFEQHCATLAETGSELSLEDKHRLEQMKQALDDLQSAGNRISRIVSDLRSFSVPETKEPGQADVLRTIAWALRTTTHEFHDRAHVMMKLDPVPMIDGDEMRLGQVFVNLLLNAAQSFAPANTDKNEVCIETSVDVTGHIQVEIRDTGEGIPENIRNRIFDPFFTTKPAGTGMGLGLSICRGIVASMGGEIQVESEVGKGTILRVLIPPAQTPSKKVSAEVIRDGPLNKGRFLVVDDDDLVLCTIKRILRDHDLVCTTNAHEALNLLKRGERFDLIFSDIMMPSMSGIAFYEALLQRDPAMAQRMIFLSGGSSSPKVDDFLKSVSNVRVEKPFAIDDLRNTVHRLLAERA